MSKYTIETGDGYLGVWKLDGMTAEVAIGTYTHIPWLSSTTAWLVLDDGPGLVATTEVRDSDTVLREAPIKKYAAGTSVYLPRAVMVHVKGLVPNGDIRAYDIDREGFRVVPADPDPMMD